MRVGVGRTAVRLTPVPSVLGKAARTGGDAVCRGSKLRLLAAVQATAGYKCGATASAGYRKERSERCIVLSAEG